MDGLYYIVQMLTKLGLSVINSFGYCVALKWPLKLMRGVSEIVLPNVVTKKGSALYAFCSFWAPYSMQIVMEFAKLISI